MAGSSSNGGTMPTPLVSTAWVADHLNEKDLRILDCSVKPLPTADGGYAFADGRDDWAGRIAGSVNVPIDTLIDPAHGGYLPVDALAQRFEPSGAADAERVITYCGGGVAACSNALSLVRLGHKNVAVYDGSLEEWTADPDAPMETS